MLPFAYCNIKPRNFWRSEFAANDLGERKLYRRIRLAADSTDGGVFFLLSPGVILDRASASFLFTENDVVEA
jgi:hypothetical protein